MHDEHSAMLVDMTKINPKWVRKITPCKENEYETTIPSKDEKKFEKVGIDFAIGVKQISEKLKHKDANCKVCGGLKQEILIDFDGKRYRFTCCRIDSLKIKRKLKETNYQKFSEYLNPVKKKPESRKAEI